MNSRRVIHTTGLDQTALSTLRSFLETAFDGDFSEHDWEHALGGAHVLVEDGDGIVAHGAVVRRTLRHRGRALATGYVEAVAVRADRRRRGLGRSVMETVGDLVRRGYDLGALSAGAGAESLYRGLGWLPWRGRTWVLAPDGLRRTPEEDGSTFVLPCSASLDLAGDLACDWREGDVW